MAIKILENIKKNLAKTKQAANVVKNSYKKVMDVQGGLLKDYLRAAPRATASVITKKEIKPQTKAEKIVFGKEPIKPIAQRVAENELKLNKAGLGRAALPLAAAGVIGATTLDIAPSLPGKKQIGKKVGTKIGEKIAEEASTFTPIKKILESKTIKPVEKTLPSLIKKPLVQEIFDPQKYADDLTKTADKAKKAGGLHKLGEIKKFYSEVKSKIVDFAAPIEDTLRKAQKKTKFKIAPESDITYQINRALRAPTIGGQFAKDNGLVDVIKKTDNLENLDQYLIAKHAARVEEQGFKTGRDLNKDSQLVEAFAPKYEQQAQMVKNYSQKLLDYSTDSGLVSKDLAEQLKVKYPDYVPLNRVFSELEKGTLNTFVKGKAIASLGKQTVLQKLKGSEREIESPVASLLAKTNEAFMQGEKNKAAQILGSYAKLEGNPFQLQEIKGAIGNQPAISFLDNGIKRTFSTTKEIAASAKALNVQQLNILGKMFAAPTRVARLGITGINIPFIAANITRDQVTAFINSKNPLRTSILNVPNFVRSLYNAVGHGKLYQEMVRMGGGGTTYDIARSQVPETIAKIRAGRNFFSKIKYTVRHPSELLRTVENIVGRAEELTRIQQYGGTKQAMLAKGLDPIAAMQEAAKAAQTNTVDFVRRGEWGTILNSTWLYLNANIQGTRTLIRNMRTRPAQTVAKIAISVLTPVAAATLWNLSDPKRKEAYQDIAEYEKENNLIVIPPNPQKDEQGRWNVIKVPFSQEINNLTSLVRRPIEQSFGFDPIRASEVAQSFLGTISPIAPTKGSISSTIVPQAIKPSIEAITNQNLFTGFKQVPASMEKLSPELQVKSYTSGTTRKIGGLIKQSPIKVEQFAKGTFGGIAPQILNVSDRVLAGLKIIPKEQIGGETIIQGILKRFNQARGGEMENKEAETLKTILTKQADESFRLKQEAEILYTELKNKPKDEANAKAKEIKKSNPLLYAKLKTVVEDDKMGLDYNDRLIKQLGVENGERAKFIWENLKAFETKEEKNNYVNDLKKKKIISDQIFKQLKQLKEKGY